MTRKLTPKAQAALEKVVGRFEAGDLSPLVAVTTIRRDPPAPFDRWSYRNRVIAYAQTDRTDLRTYCQWQEAGRQVREGSRAAFIFAPRLVPVENDDGEVVGRRLAGFRPLAVFADLDTDGPDPLPAETHTPPNPPPLAQLASRLGIPTHYTPNIPDALGDTDGARIHLASHDPAVFFHELAHALHTRLDHGQRNGETAHREAIAELTATVLMQIYGLGDRTGNAWRYIRTFHKDPLRAIYEALGTVERLLTFLFPPGAPQDD